VAEFDALIARHARRSQGWDCLSPTWAERPEAALALVRAQLDADRTSPEERRRVSEERRAAAVQRVLAALPADKHAQFKALLAQLEGYVSVREGRAYWQMVITGEMRRLLLRTGAQLVERGVLAQPDDVFFLTPDETRAPAADLRDTVAARRDEWRGWHVADPPPFIGTPGEISAAAEANRRELRGMPASRGRVTAPVRILRSPEEGNRLNRGDVLVCVMTTPAWTPLFAIAGAIVTESGGALSHPAITAREYGIPAVVALEGATTRLRDGQLVTVDGGAGTVVSAQEAGGTAVG
jgi:pyruvate,water dikinase